MGYGNVLSVCFPEVIGQAVYNIYQYFQRHPHFCEYF